MKLDENVWRSYQISKVFRENTNKINALDYSSSGELLITSSDDDSIVIYDCEEGKSTRTLLSRKYGVSLIRYTHAQNTVLHASTKIDDTVRYLSLHDNKYLRYFKGHQQRVVSLCMSPIDDTFISGAMDRSIRLWDLRSPNCAGLMHVNGRPVAAFDPEGLIFGAGIDAEYLKLYDLRSFDRGPFSTFKIPSERGTELSSISFSPDGKNILVSTTNGVLRVVDAFNGQIIQTFTGIITERTERGLHLGCCFSPDSNYVLAGSQDGHLHVWSVKTGNKIAVLEGNHPNPIGCVAFNPKYMMVASACNNAAFWIPNLEELQ
ncbi:WD repeat-containing protein 82-like [Bolinopsis microptera]|uniref:WD repeat-containing protein 82-like n=1 Tax=Bolinopsis microptera TaxID=2820187 RepID=UPI003079DAA3